ncbi:MAG: hypothetical protein IKK63_07345 [Clostridia bacterium]|nr:hypothetical protein [Clostridia bacterium]MBR3818467.1 hypothetical protein [Clostridia bacterium]
MNTEVIVSLITLCGSALGTFAGIAVNSKLTNFRLEQLEKRVNKHNNVIERTGKLEERVGALDYRLKEIESR